MIGSICQSGLMIIDGLPMTSGLSHHLVFGIPHLFVAVYASLGHHLPTLTHRPPACRPWMLHEESVLEDECAVPHVDEEPRTKSMARLLYCTLALTSTTQQNCMLISPRWCTASGAPHSAVPVEIQTGTQIKVKTTNRHVIRAYVGALIAFSGSYVRGECLAIHRAHT